MIIANKEIKHGVAGTAHHGLNNLVRVRGESRILDGDSIEGLKVVNEA
jgi:hypothetical protein